LHELREFEGLKGYPWLVGTSRKSFIGRITGVETPSERTWGTAVTVTEAVRGGADIVRVHDVSEMAKVVKMADAIWRVEDSQKQMNVGEEESDGSMMDHDMDSDIEPDTKFDMLDSESQSGSGSESESSSQTRSRAS